MVCDEPVSALDVSVQAQGHQPAGAAQDDLGLSYVFISHDLSVVQHISDTVLVMCLGHEDGAAEKDALFEPLHPYTQALLKQSSRFYQIYEHASGQAHPAERPQSPPNAAESCVRATTASA